VLRYGGDYNPEQWPPEVWKEDVALMRRAGVNLVSVGVFAWARLEPREGAYTFGWLDEVLDLLHAGGIDVALATPTAAPPPWFSLAHPDALPVTASGTRLWHGSRDTYCMSAPAYRAACRRIAGALADRYAGHPALALWHVHNEYGTVCRCDHVAAAFRGWLRARYGDLDTLNDAWTTAFWSQHYSDWAQVLPPRATQYLPNPAHALDFRRFCSDELLAAFVEQRDVLRAATPAVPVTTNFALGSWVPVDHARWARAVDVGAESDPNRSKIAEEIVCMDTQLLTLRGATQWNRLVTETPHLSRRGLLAAGAAGAAALVVPAGAARAEPTPDGGAIDGAATGHGGSGRNRYTWRNVEIVGGGFVPGIVFNQREPGLVYARTDIGGAYRWNRANNRWIPLLDWVGWDRWGYSGVVSLATDAVDPDRLYVAAGTYTNDWDPNNGAILRSRDRGATWKVSPLPFKLGGNMPGRGMGERLAIDPNRNNILYLGVRGGHGLWRSTDFGATWARVASFPNAGSYQDDPNDASGYSSDNQGVLWVTFDPRTGSRRRATQTIYVGVADKENMLYRSTDAGATWERVAGQPTGYIPHKGVLDAAGGLLYVATSDTAGPYSGNKGDLWKLDTAAGTWTRISPVPSDSPDDYFGYSGLTLDRQRPGTLMVATQISWWPDVIFFRSTDSGATWTRAWDIPSWPDRVNRYDIDIAESPWLTWNATPGAPEQAPKLGWMTESVEIDPFNSNRLLYGTGATIYGTDNLTDWDSGGTVHISVRARGLEECAILDLISPPVGANLFSAVGDVGGFVHSDFTRPGLMYANPTISSTTSLDFAGLAPAVIVRVGNGNAPRLGVSADSGATWTPAATEPAGTSGGGVAAIAADGKRIVWAPAGGAVSWSADNGATWTASAGLPAGATTTVESDRADAARFYAFAAGVFYLSTDGGATFAATAAAGLPAEGNVRFKAVPGVAGDVWFAGGKDGLTYGLWHSTDSGRTFTRLRNVQEADTIGFGKAAPGRRYPTLFSSAQIRGVRGIFRSDDRGRSWTRINDDGHQYAWTGAAITGDPRVYGRVYVATNGRGIIYGDLR
jgi:hypothetical protein